MKPLLSTFDKKLLNRIQENLPITSRPFKVIAEELGCSEQQVIQRVNWLKEQGFIRRMGAFFNSAGLGYISTLVALRVDTDFLPNVAGKINLYNGVTHNYERLGFYNLWFTLITKNEQVQQQIITEVKAMEGVREVINLPARQKFKVNVKFTLE